MEPKAHHVIIGFFTLAAVSAALLFALWLGKSSTDTNWAYYRIGFDHPVGGLAKGNPVLYTGVPVGDVLDLTLAPDNPAHVRVLVRVNQDIPVRENTRAGLVLANITGSMSIQFTGGTPDSPILEGHKDNPPLIAAEPSAFSNLLTNGEAMLGKAEQLLESANQLMSENNLSNIAEILENTRQASESLLASRDELEALMAQFDAAGIRAEEAAIKVSAAADRSREVLDERVEPVLLAMSRALTTLQPTLDRLDTLTGDNELALDAGLQGLGEITPALRELRSTLRNLNSFTRRLEQDPTGTLWGGAGIKEYEQ
ncbi:MULTISPECIES: MlaD family protein [Marinobacter]|uniref:MCE family protein n=2 Tax=Marinobacter TaxID=2742 RepID=A0A350RS42_MARNT|nr:MULTISPECIES: MlaD family protein [unclassified Marinobacter]MBH92499.1 ABC transporter permease [Marinobacter sp.]MEC9384807.1 MlaD family protein [Pseudomonadota bacterium]HAC30058.1 MCE family protein [Marinobacter nauticus]HAX08610.1 MCE family protein [Marinobacter nauticus]|tara:strand:+ start:738 stop:1676 length:939 start_codon:yes stop_codon:yes gene_type:complete